MSIIRTLLALVPDRLLFDVASRTLIQFRNRADTTATPLDDMVLDVLISVLAEFRDES